METLELTDGGMLLLDQAFLLDDAANRHFAELSHTFPKGPRDDKRDCRHQVSCLPRCLSRHPDNVVVENFSSMLPDD